MPTSNRDQPGQQLRRIREQLELKYRDVHEASRRIAKRHGNLEFVVGLSRLADIENKCTIPSIYRIYSLSAIYGLDFRYVLSLFGVPLAGLAADSIRLGLGRTREARFLPDENLPVELPDRILHAADLRETSYFSRHLNRWGKLPVLLLKSLDMQKQRYAFIGTGDRSMYPMIRPGSFVQIDETKRYIRKDTAQHEFERPLYFLEHRKGFRCGWCTLSAGMLIVQSHPASGAPPVAYKYPGEIDVIGQVVAVAMRFDSERIRRTRSSTSPK